MSEWVRGRRDGSVSASVYAILGKCRSKARMLLAAKRQESAGNELKAQALRGRAERGLTQKARAQLAKEKRTGRRARLSARRAPAAPIPAKPAETGFSLKQESAAGRKTAHFENLGRGKIGSLFDMKKGDLPGQTTLMDRFGTKHTQEGIVRKPFFEHVLDAARKAAPAHSFGHAGDKVLIHHVHEEFAKTPEGHGMSLEEFKRQITETGENRIKLNLGRHDMPHTGPPLADQQKSSTRYLSAEFHHIRIPARGPADTQLGRQLPKISGGSPDAILQRGRESLERRARLATKLKSLRAQDLEQRQPEIHGKPGKSYEMATNKIEFDPDRFQYKLAAQGAHGVTEALSDVKAWDPELAGVVSVWRDPANGKSYVVNGHHRLDLAKKMGVKNISVKYLEAKTAEEARAKGALTNIAEGRGTAIDAAKFFRDTGGTAESLRAKGVSLKEHTATQGLAMSGLEEKAFLRLTHGELSPGRAAIIGGSGLSHPQQAQLLKVLDKPKNAKLTDGTVRNMVDRAKAAGSHTVRKTDLFGTNDEEEALYIHQAKVEEHIQRSLSEDKRLFGLVSKSKAAQALAERGGSTIDTETTGKVGSEAASVLHLFDQLKNRDPKISRPLSQAAERIANGENLKTVQADARKAVTARIKAILEGDVNPFE